MVDDYELNVGLLFLSIAMLVIIIAAFLGNGAGGASHAVKSDEFVYSQTGAPRFQRYETNDDDLGVVVDSETGTAYLVTPEGVTVMLDADGNRETIAEVGE